VERWLIGDADVARTSTATGYQRCKAQNLHKLVLVIYMGMKRLPREDVSGGLTMCPEVIESG